MFYSQLHFLIMLAFTEAHRSYGIRNSYGLS